MPKNRSKVIWNGLRNRIAPVGRFSGNFAKHKQFTDEVERLLYWSR